LLTCHEEIGHVGRGCYEDPHEDVRDKSCVSGSWNSENDATHGQTGSTVHRSRPPVDQSGKRVAKWMGKSPDTPATRRHPREDLREDVGRVGEDVTRMLRENCFRGIRA